MTTMSLDARAEDQRRRAIVAGVVGNVLEWYDFGVYGYFVSTISKLFFPSGDPIASLLLTFAVFVIGHFSADLRNFDQVVDSPAAVRLARGLFWVLPNLAQFDVKSQVVHAEPVPLGYVALTAGYAALYIAMLLTIAVYVFSRRDFK